MRAALYARYSTDKQSESSLSDQLRVCERLARQHGFTIVARYSDAAISGGTAQRPEYQSMLEAARRREFDVIIAEDTSRLWRNMAEQAPRLAELTDLGVAVVTHDLDTRAETAGILSAVNGAMSEQYRREIGRRTRRGLEGRARQQKPTGGRAYGYRTTGDQRAIDDAQASIVREIFSRFASGETLRAIAADLNIRKVPSAGATWNRTTNPRDGLWRVSALHELLHNEIYIGRLVWNRSRWIRSAIDSKKRRRVENPPEQWIVHERPDLRIIDEDTWARVQRRLHERATLYKPGRGGRAKYLLSGLLRCACCGAAFTIAAHRPVRYACSTRRTAGDQACPNGIMVARDLVERKIVDTVRDRLLSGEARELAVRAIRQAAKEEAYTPNPELARVELQIRELERLRREGILSAEVAGVALRQAYRDREALLRAPGAEVIDPVFGAEAAYLEAMDQLEAVLEGEDAAQAREALREVIDSIQLHPREGVLWAELRTGRQLALVNWNGSGGSIWTQLTGDRAA